MPRGTTPVPVHSGQVMPNWDRIALRMKSLLFGRLFRNSASSSSTLNATIFDLVVVLRGMAQPGEAEGLSNPTAADPSRARRNGPRARQTTAARSDYPTGPRQGPPVRRQLAFLPALNFSSLIVFLSLSTSMSYFGAR